MWGAILGGASALYGLATQGSNDRRQINQQEKLTDIQEKSNQRLMQESFALQKGMYDHTYNKNTPLQQMKNLKEAGVNPAMMYGLGGQGGATAGGGGASVGGGSAADTASMENAQTNKMGMALQYGMMQSQIKVNEAQANKMNADAELTQGETTNEKRANIKNMEALTETENKKRDMLIENMKQEGLGRFLNNIEEDYKMNQGRGSHGSSEVYNEKYEWVARIEGDSYVREGMTAAIIKTEAEAGNQAAQALLGNKKAEGYYQELQNDIMKAVAAGKQAENSETISKAIKLAAEFDTGEFTNWKTWTNLGIESVNALGNTLGKISPKGLVKEPAKALLNTKPVKGFR